MQKEDVAVGDKDGLGMFVLTTTQWRFTYVDLALQPQFPTVLRLTVTDSPRGSPARCETEATVSQTLRTPQLPTAHGLVGYRWQNTGSYSLINARATSCRTVPVTVYLILVRVPIQGQVEALGRSGFRLWASLLRAQRAREPSLQLAHEGIGAEWPAGAGVGMDLVGQ